MLARERNGTKKGRIVHEKSSSIDDGQVFASSCDEEEEQGKDDEAEAGNDL